MLPIYNNILYIQIWAKYIDFRPIFESVKSNVFLQLSKAKIGPNYLFWKEKRQHRLVF